MAFLSGLFGDSTNRFLKEAQKIVDAVNKLEPTFESFSLEQIQAKSTELKNKIQKEGLTLEEILPEAFALVREASRRTLGQRHFDVQIIGSLVLNAGSVAEMKTGEGKTLAATMAVYLNALSGQGVHVVTVNDFLARRDTAWMGEIYDILGLSIACINQQASFIYDPNFKEGQEALDRERDELGNFRIVQEFLRPVSRREAYEADITYGTNNEFGFDYLRDNMAYDLSQRVQAKGHNFAIVDEVDSILIDESRTPLIISAAEEDSGNLYAQFAGIVPRLKEDEDYNVDEKLKAVTITEVGIEKIEKILNIENIYTETGVRYVHHLEQALRAQVLFEKDKHYVVRDGKVIIVDEFTGRLMPGRRWSGGLHQAVEAKEGVTIEKESRTMATITFQNYFRLYKKLSGMTGTGATSEEEFRTVYGMTVIKVPTNRPLLRLDQPDRIYKTETGKFRALVSEIQDRHKNGQPVLVGTASIQKNELVGNLLGKAGIKHEILNAKNHEREGEIIAQAGKLGAVTIATNLAGRGVDIILGGNPATTEKAQQIKSLGGLHVIGTERHEARRIDDQLRGRAGRQGDPGSSQFFVSAEDEVIRVFGGDRFKNILDRLGVPEDEAIENKLVSRAIEQAQSRIEGHHFDSRKYVLQYDDVMNRHRQVIYENRNKILSASNPEESVRGYLSEVIDRIISAHIQKSESGGELWDQKEISESLKALITPFNLPDNFKPEIENFYKANDKAGLLKYCQGVITQALKEKEDSLGTEQFRNISRALVLRVVDELWVDHLETMDQLRESVRLRAYGQQDPLVEYRVEGQQLFESLLEAVKLQTANLIFKVQIQIAQPQSKIQKTVEGASTNNQVSGSGKKIGSSAGAQRVKMGRNDPCYCGSGKKYKRCHGA